MKNFIFNKEVLPGKLRAIKEYGKFVTRRTQGLEFININPDNYVLVDEKDTLGYPASEGKKWFGLQRKSQDHFDPIYFHARYSVGERVFIREPFCWKVDPITSVVKEYEFWYKLDDNNVEFLDDGDGSAVINKDGTFRSPWKSPYAMKEEYARYFGTVTSVRLERLQEITEADAKLEGAEFNLWCGNNSYNLNNPPHGVEPCYRTGFVSLWNSLSKPPLMWESNPYVFRYEVEVK